MNFKTLTLVAALSAALAPAAHAQISDGVVRIGVLTDLSGVYSDVAGKGACRLIGLTPSPAAKKKNSPKAHHIARAAAGGEEILDAGVQVIAQPPGKKNQTIHLLSGGEKALTAIALVFAIFQLNPAPFCLLDEVDAPLDDANTERYAKLVKSMSKETQFLFISHNKIAMEMAEQLIGVTMQEQGVSRIVAVDMESALGFAELAA